MVHSRSLGREWIAGQEDVMKWRILVSVTVLASLLGATEGLAQGQLVPASDEERCAYNREPAACASVEARKRSPKSSHAADFNDWRNKSDFGNLLCDPDSGTCNAIENTAAKIDSLKNAVSDVIDGAGDLPASVFDGVKNGAKTVFDGVDGALDSMVDTADGLIEDGSGYFGGSGTSAAAEESGTTMDAFTVEERTRQFQRETLQKLSALEMEGEARLRDMEESFTSLSDPDGEIREMLREGQHERLHRAREYQQDVQELIKQEWESEQPIEEPGANLRDRRRELEDMFATDSYTERALAKSAAADSSWETLTEDTAAKTHAAESFREDKARDDILRQERAGRRAGEMDYAKSRARTHEVNIDYKSRELRAAIEHQMEATAYTAVSGGGWSSALGSAVFGLNAHSAFGRRGELLELFGDMRRPSGGSGGFGSMNLDNLDLGSFDCNALVSGASDMRTCQQLRSEMIRDGWLNPNGSSLGMDGLERRLQQETQRQGGSGVRGATPVPSTYYNRPCRSGYSCGIR